MFLRSLPVLCSFAFDFDANIVFRPTVASVSVISPNPAYAPCTNRNANHDRQAPGKQPGRRTETTLAFCQSPSQFRKTWWQARRPELGQGQRFRPRHSERRNRHVQVGCHGVPVAVHRNAYRSHSPTALAVGVCKCALTSAVCLCQRKWLPNKPVSASTSECHSAHARRTCTTSNRPIDITKQSGSSRGPASADMICQPNLNLIFGVFGFFLLLPPPPV